jgi:Asp/Glu/hydantoin racemase
VAAIIGDCGFLALYQEALQRAVGIPVITSSLLLVPIVSRMIPYAKRIGILTYRADTLREDHFRGAGWNSNDIRVAVAGVEDRAAWQLFRTSERSFHAEDLGRELLDVCRELLRTHPDIGAFVLECAVMPVFAHKIQEETGLPVFDITSLANRVVGGLSRKPFK